MDHSGDEEDIFGPTTEQNLDIVLDKDHANKSRETPNVFKCNEKILLITYNYWLSNIYMDIDPSNPNKLRIFFKTGKDKLDARIDYDLNFTLIHTIKMATLLDDERTKQSEELILTVDMTIEHMMLMIEQIFVIKMVIMVSDEGQIPCMAILKNN